MARRAKRGERVGVVMAETVRCIDDDAPLRSAAVSMYEGGVGALGVLDRGELIGLISERDVTRAVADGSDLGSETVGSYMTRSPRYLTPADTVATAARIMVQAGVRHLPVVDEDELVGMVSMRDLTGVLLGRAEPRTVPLEIEEELSHPGG